MFLVQGANELVEPTLHDIVELVQGEVDAVVGHAALGKIIRPDALRAIAGADLEFTRLRLFTLLLFPFAGEQPRLKQEQ